MHPPPSNASEAVASEGARIRAVLTIGAARPDRRRDGRHARSSNWSARWARATRTSTSTPRVRAASCWRPAPGTNDDCVADHALGLVIAAVRDFRRLDRLCREGVWRTAIAQPPNVSGKRLGILGLGPIGQKIARRAAAFDLQIGYHNRKPKAGVAASLFRQPAGARRMVPTC